MTMKTHIAIAVVLATFIIVAGCTGKGSGRRNTSTANDTVTVPDTGYTGIKQYYSNERLLKEVTFKNGVREGLTKTYYQTGQLYQTFWYRNGMRQDSSIWYYLEGQVFRTTPYKNDTINGIQKQYYRTGKLRAKIGYNKGIRTPLLEEYDQKGKLVSNYPEILADIHDEYSSKGIYRINLSLSDKTARVKFFRGEFTDGRFDTTRIQELKITNGISSLILKKTGTASPGYVGVIAEMVTSFRNRHFIYKRIDLPYNDLN
jgi:antitoxin component YwqK of YwqJK toxin-antitoxin module